MSHFLAMGGYAQYVWSAYGISCVVLIATVWFTRRQHSSTLERLRQLKLSQQEHRS